MIKKPGMPYYLAEGLLLVPGAMFYTTSADLSFSYQIVPTLEQLDPIFNEILDTY
jgi:hypothetical protein